jgi:molybdopterin molybdotransferase
VGSLILPIPGGLPGGPAGGGAPEERARVLSVTEALERILAGVPVLPPESVPLAAALGRVLAEPVIAGREIPPWDNSAMDGYAVRAVDTRAASAGRPVTLAVVGEVAAGAVASRELGPGQAYRILTGAPLPGGSDAVVPQEDVRRHEGEVWLERPVSPGACVRPRGEDIRCGDLVLEPGTVLRPAALGVLAALGRARVDVHRRPVVAVLSTGDELVAPGAPLGPGQIPDSNTYTLCGLVAEAGATPRSLGIARDRREELLERLREGFEADVLVSSAGVSVGDRDFVREAVEALGARLDFWKVNMRPGKPLTFGRLPGRPGGAAGAPGEAHGEGRLFFGLPGNPVSCMVTFELFVRPALRRMGGHGVLERPRVRARALDPIDNPGTRPGYLRVRLEPVAGGLGARPTGEQGSAILRSMLVADGLAVVPGDTRIAPGEEVEVILLVSDGNLSGRQLGIGRVEPG